MGQGLERRRERSESGGRMERFIGDAALIYKGVVLSVAVLCTAALLFCAGGNAVGVFSQQTRQEKEKPPARGALSGLTIAVDPGHGGYDGGAVGRVSGTPEKEINLDVSLRLAELLRAQGADVLLTRTDDYALCDENPPIRKKLQDMQRRAELIAQGGADMVLSIHMNEYAGRRESGPQVFFREDCPAGRLLAGALQEAMIQGLEPETKRTALSGDYYILTLGVPSALVECGFLSNREEEARLLTGEYRQQIAQAVTDGVLAWAALPGQKPAPLEKVDRSNEPKGD